MYRSGPPEEAATAYQAEIEPLGRFDLVHLGLGPDGHTASLFPDSTALAVDDSSVLVVANRDPNHNNPHDRITLTLGGIARARLVVFTVTDQSKHDPFSRIVGGANLPASRVIADEVLWLVDADVVGDTVLPT
jgi:6-phosphogluconolactonase